MSLWFQAAREVDLVVSSPPMPDSLHSNKPHEVVVIVNGGLQDPGTDVVLTVTAMMNGAAVPAALEGLMNKPVASKFVPDKKGKLRRILLSAQLAEKSLPMVVEVDGAFRPGEWPASVESSNWMCDRRHSMRCSATQVLTNSRNTGVGGAESTSSSFRVGCRAKRRWAPSVPN